MSYFGAWGADYTGEMNTVDEEVWEGFKSHFKLKSLNWILKPQSQGGVAMQFYFCPRQGQGSKHNPKKIQVTKFFP